jgi:hypothetical protein
MSGSRKAVRAFAAALAIAGIANAGPILEGDLVVSRVGDGTTTLSSTSTPTSVLEFSTLGGAPLQTIPMPIAASGSNNPYSAAGTSTEQFITMSNDGTTVLLGGYNAVPGAVTTVANTGAGRILARIPVSTGTPDTSTSLTDFGTSSANNIRSVSSLDGSSFWVATATGVRYVASTAATTSTSLSTLNSRVANIVGGQLYDTSSSGTNTNKGVNTVSGGLATTTGQTITRLPGMTDAVTVSSWDYVFGDATTLYVTDDSPSATVGGVQKWMFDGTNWNLKYRMFTDGTLNFGARGLAGRPDGLGNFILYTTTNEGTNGSNNRLMTIADPLSATTLGSQVFTQLATAGANFAFRGVDIVPEPGSLAALAGAATLLGLRRRRKS